MQIGLDAYMVEGLHMFFPIFESTETGYGVQVEYWGYKPCLQEIGVQGPRAAKLWYDNIEAKYLSTNPVFHACTEYIEVDYIIL
jgi:hypothetical protein